MQFNLTPVVKILLLINVSIFALGQFAGVPIVGLFGLRYPASSQFFPHQFLTYMFTQADLGHLFTNMLGLFMFGPMLERFWGGQRFLFFYLFTGIGASLLYTGINAYHLHQLQQGTEAYVQSPTPSHLRTYIREYASGERSLNYENIERFNSQFEDNTSNPALKSESIGVVREIYRIIYNDTINIPMVGASGAIFGILMAFGLLFPNTELFLLFIPFPIKAKYFVAMYGLYEFFAGVRRVPGDNVAHFAHLGGMLFAFILIRYWGSKRDKFY
jgi:membrane associated rhomboid family serine protease